MIRMTLMIIPASTVTLRELWDVSLGGVIAELRASGYSVDEDARAETVDLARWEHAYAIEPDAGVLSAIAFDEEGGLIWISLTGDRFCGQGYLDRDNDAALWDRLEALANRISAAHRVITDVGDPDIVIGVEGAPGTYIPPGVLPGYPDDQS
jgi:hypothetical protein